MLPSERNLRPEASTSVGRRVLAYVFVAAPVALIALLAILCMFVVVFYLTVLVFDFYWSFSTLIDAIVIFYVNWGLYRAMQGRRADALVRWFASLDAPQDGAPRAELLGPFGNVGDPRSRRRRWWRRVVVALLASGVGLYVVFFDVETYLRTLQVHMWLGLAFFVVYLFTLHRFVFRVTDSKRVAWEFVFCPLFFEFSTRTVAPLSLFFLYNIAVYPLYLLVRLMQHTPAASRKAALVWYAWFYGMLTALETGVFIVTDPTNLRFEFVQRIWHAHFGVYLALVTLASLPLFVRRRRLRLELPASTLLLSWFLVAVGSILATQQLHALKARIQERHYAANTHGSPPYDRLRQVRSPRLHPQALNGSVECLNCHRVAFEQWAVSAHAYAVKNRPFQAIAKSLIERHGLEFVRDCATCHEPALAFSDRLELLVDPDYLDQSEGVSCRACHLIDWSADHNGIYRVRIPRADVVYPAVADRATFMKLAVLEHVTDFTKPHIVSGETCYTCHSLRAKRAGRTVVPLDNVSSFLASSFAREKKVKCHDCHMPRIEKDDFSYSWRDHRLFGSHVLLDRMSFETQPEKLRKLQALTRANRDFLFSNLSILHSLPSFMDTTFKTYRYFNYLDGLRKVLLVHDVNEGRVAFRAQVKEVAVSGQGADAELTFAVHVDNPKLGHDFPSSLFANLVRVWSECRLTDATGRTLLQTGWQPENYEHQLGRIEVTDDGQPILPFESLDYNRLVNLKYIRPDTGYADRHRAPLPPDVQWPLRLHYVLKYRRYDAAQLSWSDDRTLGRQLPDLTLLTHRAVIPEPEAAGPPTPREPAR